MTTENKTLKAVAPYTHSGFLNFKFAPFEAWKRNGGKEARSHYPWAFPYTLLSCINVSKKMFEGNSSSEQFIIGFRP